MCRWRCRVECRGKVQGEGAYEESKSRAFVQGARCRVHSAGCTNLSSREVLRPLPTQLEARHEAEGDLSTEWQGLPHPFPFRCL